MKKALAILVATASITRGGALVLNGTHMIRSSERIALGITIPQQAIGRTIKVTVDESKDKTQSGLVFAEIDATQINDATATRLEVVRVYQTALRNQNPSTNDQTSAVVTEVKPQDEAKSQPAEQTEQPQEEPVEA